MIEQKVKGKEELKIHLPNDNLPEIKAMLFNIWMLDSKTPFSHLDSRSYKVMCVYLKAGNCSAHGFVNYRLPRIEDRLKK